MQKHSKIFVSLSLLVIPTSIFSQELVSTSGDSYSNKNGSIDFSIGEIAIETQKSSNGYLTQGFHQSSTIVITVSEEVLPLVYQIKVFPNPSSSFIEIESSVASLQYQLCDIQSKEFCAKTSFDFHAKIDVNFLSPGTYILKIFDHTNTQIQTLKLVIQ